MNKGFSNILIIGIIAAVVLIGTGVGGYLVWNRSVRCDAVFPGVTNLKDVSIIYTEGTMTGSQKIVISGEGQSFLLSDFRSDTPAVHARVGVITEDKLRNLLDIFEDGGFVCMKEYYDYPRSLRPTDLAQETVILHINDFTRKVSEYGGSGPSALHRITGQILAVGKDLNPIAKGEERKFCSDMISTILKIKEDISSFAKWCERALNISSLTVGGSDFSDWKTYRNEKYGFEVRYPPNFSGPEQDIYEGAPGVRFAHSIPVEYCSLAGKPCQPETIDMSIGFFVADKPFESVKERYKNIEIYPELKSVWPGDAYIDGVKGFQAFSGAEGEGHFYVIAPIPNSNQTIIIQRSYIDEESLTIYQGVKDFISFEEQKKIFFKILSTFKFVEPN